MLAVQVGQPFKYMQCVLTVHVLYALLARISIGARVHRLASCPWIPSSIGKGIHNTIPRAECAAADSGNDQQQCNSAAPLAKSQQCPKPTLQSCHHPRSASLRSRRAADRRLTRRRTAAPTSDAWPSCATCLRETMSLHSGSPSRHRSAASPPSS